MGGTNPQEPPRAGTFQGQYPPVAAPGQLPLQVAVGQAAGAQPPGDIRLRDPATLNDPDWGQWRGTSDAPLTRVGGRVAPHGRA